MRSWRGRCFKVVHHLAQANCQETNAKGGITGAENRLYFKACIRPPSNCLVGQPRASSKVNTQGSSVHSLNDSIAPQIDAEVKKIQSFALGAFSVKKSGPVIMRPFVC